MEFLLADWLGTPVWFWLSFAGIVLALTAFDLGVLHKDDREMGVGESLKLTGFYISIALAFGVWVWIEKGADLGMKYYTGFFIETALSIDNVFVISMIFTFFAIPAKYQYRALLLGILAVIVLRGVMIAAGAVLVDQAYWVLYIFAAFLIYTGVRMMWASDHAPDISKNPAVKWISTHMRVTKELHAERFFVKVPDDKTGKLVTATTPLFLALAAMVHRFHYLKYALAAVLVFIGTKIFVADFILGGDKFPLVASLAVTFALIAAGVLYSLWKTRGEGLNVA